MTIATDIVVIANRKFHLRTFGIPYLVAYVVALFFSFLYIRLLYRTNTNVVTLWGAGARALAMTMLFLIPFWYANNFLMEWIFGVSVLDI